jgi:hypothetical protein
VPDTKPTFEDCLHDLAERFDATQEQLNDAAWQAFTHDEIKEDVFIAPPRRPAPPRVPWPDIAINDAQEDYELMLWDQFHGVSKLLAIGSSLVPCVRCNYGTGILASLFGCPPFVMPRETNTLPTASPLSSRTQVEAAIAAGIPDIRSGLGERVFTCEERFQEVFQQYSVLKRYITLYYPDVQGPVDVAELVCGSQLFLAFYEDPQFVHALLNVATETYRRFMQEWYRRVPATGDVSIHWGLMHGGRLMLRNDSLMNLSSEFYEEFVQPYDEKLFREFGGGAIHFCGRLDHSIAALSRTRGLTAVNVFQPELNNMETIYQHTVDRGIRIIGLPWSAVTAARIAKRSLHGQVHSQPA